MIENRWPPKYSCLDFLKGWDLRVLMVGIGNVSREEL
jgi:hypothetical protein